jgi:hypothetical protein
MSAALVAGGCFCRAVRYEFAAGDYPAGNCHCTMCRRTSAAPFVAWVVVPQSAFRYSQGAPAVLASSDHGKRFFCDKCGTHLACVIAEHPEIVDVTIGSLDDPELFVPRFELHTDTRLTWLNAIGHSVPGT